jgi:hypothetical protein
MKVLKWARLPSGSYEARQESGAYTIERTPYGSRFSFQALHLGKYVGFAQPSFALAKRDAQQHANGFRGNVASTDSDFKAKSEWCHCSPEGGEQ